VGKIFRDIFSWIFKCVDLVVTIVQKKDFIFVDIQVHGRADP